MSAPVSSGRSAPRRAKAPSLRLKLTAQLLAGAALMSLLLYSSVSYLSEQAAQRTYDNVLGASAISIVDAVRAERGEVRIDIPYAALSMLGEISEDRVFYRVLVNGETVTGYEDLPSGPVPRPPQRTAHASSAYRGEEVRLAAAGRRLTVEARPVEVVAIVAQTTQSRDIISRSVSNAAALIGLGFFLTASVLAWATTESALAPIRRLAQLVGQRGPGDLRPLREATPAELAPLQSALNRLMTRLGSAITRSEDFIAEAAHRIRTPLATVRAKAEIALRRAEEAEDRQAIREIVSAVDASSRSAGQLLDHAMVRLRRDQKLYETVELFELVSAVIESIRPSAELKDIAIEPPHRPNAPLRIDGDPVLLEGALRNLLDNAVKYSAAESTVTVSLARLGDSARIRIVDQGRGFGAEPTAPLLNRFRRGDNARDVIGSGLGLTIAAEAAAAHGGRLSLSENEQERGACVDFWLPLGRG